MERLLFIFMLCSGFTPLVLSIHRKFYLIQQLKTWNDALTYCRSFHTDLVSISTNDDLIKLQNEALKYQFTSSAWIGLYLNMSTWRWSYKDETPVYINWNMGTVPPNPNNLDGIEECGAINSGPGVWRDYPCFYFMPFVCYDETKTGSSRYYYDFSNKLTWLGAQSYCRQYFTDLATIRNPTENSAVQAVITHASWPTFIGLFRDSWKWSDQSLGSPVQWMFKQPDNALNYENCAYIINGQAADTLCSDLRSFFCYTETTGQQQIIRLKIQSNQDVNDPAFMSTILEMMKQKLADVGVAGNITVTWRKRPDGVFHKLIPPQAITTNSTCDINLF